MERISEPRTDNEGELLRGWLRFHREALASKCEGMTDQQLLTQSSPPSTLTLLGLVRHLTEMESHYLVRALSGVDKGFVYCTDDDDEADIEHLDVSMIGGSMSRWQDTLAEANELLSAQPELSAQVAAGWGSVRWHLLKVIQEYSRHNGHADIIRERIDGLRGE
ncbi:MAG: DinB family protein [Propionibacteriales bacterium]|nr:DinB family protein [Propionibacteriales bacterium]